MNILPVPPIPMMTPQKKKAMEALKRLEGLSVKVRSMIEDDVYCPKILENLLAMQGHVKHAQAKMLESHLHTCAKKNIGTKKGYDTFVSELIHTIGLSRR